MKTIPFIAVPNGLGQDRQGCSRAVIASSKRFAVRQAYEVAAPGAAHD